jgi:sporulation-control protein spo0M
MLGKVKSWLGIEGVKVNVLIPDTIRESDGKIIGKILLQTMHAQTVATLTITLIERYSRGLGKNRLTDEYELAQISLRPNITVQPDQAVELDFELPFSLVKSDIESFGSKNILFKGVAKLALLSRKATSTYRVEAQATVIGTALPPFDRKEIQIA